MHPLDENEALYEFAEKIKNRSDFNKFLKLYIKDYKKCGDFWQNGDLETFLSCIERFSSSVDGYYKNIHPTLDPELPTWRIFAEILLSARSYE